MITCGECRRNLYPEDPSIRLGKYHMSTCESYCNKPDYYRDLEQPKPEPEIPDIPEVRQLKYQVEQAKAGYLHLQNKLNEHLDKAKNGKGKDIL
uniref:Uncharacterized protein n=1 Tax=viral metagenome TaxID=1070528 RepID=A0A6M3L6L1_9ZZZZ